MSFGHKGTVAPPPVPEVAADGCEWRYPLAVFARNLKLADRDRAPCRLRGHCRLPIGRWQRYNLRGMVRVRSQSLAARVEPDQCAGATRRTRAH